MELLHIPTFVIRVLLPAILFGYLYCLYKINYWKRRGVQQHSNTHLVFGNVKKGVLFRTAPGYHFGDMYRAAPEDSPFLGFYIFHKPCLLLRDPEIIKQIFIREFDKFSDRHFAGRVQKDSFTMINLFGLNNPTWKYVRSKLNKCFTLHKLKKMFPLMMESAESMVEYLKDHVGYTEGVLIDAQDINYKLSGDITANIAFGTNTDSFNDPRHSMYSRYLLDFYKGFRRMVALITVFFIPELVQTIGTPILFDPTFVSRIFWNVFKSREKSGDKRGDFIDCLMELKNGEQNNIYKFEGDNLLYQSGMFMSGFESSSTVAAFTLMELSNNKEYQQRAREDIEQAVDKHGWTYQAFDNMKYLDMCIDECMRLYPPVSVLDRCALERYKIPDTDVVIEKGTPVFISLYGLHRDSKYFSDPEVYNPERFANENNTANAYMPFGLGPRKCVGSHMGRLQTKISLALLLSEYEVSPSPGAVHRLDSRATFTAAADGLHLLFRKIHH